MRFFLFLIILFFAVEAFSQDKTFAQAAKLFDDEQFEEAMPFLSQIIADGSSDSLGVAYFYRAMSHFSLDQMDSVIADAEMAISLMDQKDERLWHALHLKSLMLILEDKVMESIALNDSILSVRPNFSLALFGRARRLQEMEAYTASLRDFDRLIEIEPDELDYRFFRSIVYLKMDEDAKALADMNLIIERDSTDAATYYNRSGIYRDQKKFELALSDLHRYAALRPDDYRGYRGMTNVLQELDRYEEALVWVDKWIATDTTENNRSKEIKGIIYLALFRFEDAVNVFETLSMEGFNGPTDYARFNNIGYAFIHVGKYEKALSFLDMGLIQYPEAPYLYNNRAYVYMKLNRLEEAETDLTKSIELDAANTYAIRNRALLHLARKEKKKACKDYAKCLNMGHDQRDPELAVLEKNCQ
ncbi:MAG: tetratricopeptide repeat protein [Bacteroidota bacterium]